MPVERIIEGVQELLFNCNSTETVTAQVMTVFEGLLDEYEVEDPKSAEVFRNIVMNVKVLASGDELSMYNLGAGLSPIPEDELEGFALGSSSIVQKILLEEFQKKASKKSLVGDARVSMCAIADRIVEEVYPEDWGQVTAKRDLAAAMARLEDLMFEDTIVVLSPS
ncbi:hypothetical protein DPEC_G00348760 [Dallia pectoralis]|uniref:Uncharacterized protein n=1 Tax=Dallia pectoralis TaxID=75939 RepID=A0ACC2F141_DALPE|nr:hypothetical protein DPEC_G00348760 [Dallia pectoralis]